MYQGYRLEQVPLTVLQNFGSVQSRLRVAIYFPLLNHFFSINLNTEDLILEALLVGLRKFSV